MAGCILSSRGFGAEDQLLADMQALKQAFKAKRQNGKYLITIKMIIKGKFFHINYTTKIYQKHDLYVLVKSLITDCNI